MQKKTKFCTIVLISSPPKNVVNRDPTRPLFFGNWIASWNCIEIENCLCYISRGSVKLNNFHTNSCDFTFAMLLHYWRWQLARSRFLCNWYNFPQARGLNYRKFKMRNNTCWSVKISRFKRSYYYCRIVEVSHSIDDGSLTLISKEKFSSFIII